jgi:hypothetical protein
MLGMAMFNLCVLSTISVFLDIPTNTTPKPGFRP